MSVLLEDHVPPTVFMGTVTCMDYTQKIIIVDFAVPMKVGPGAGCITGAQSQCLVDLFLLLTVDSEVLQRRATTATK